MRWQPREFDLRHNQKCNRQRVIHTLKATPMQGSRRAGATTSRQMLPPVKRGLTMGPIITVRV